MNIFAFSGFLNAMVFLTIGLFVFFKKRDRLNVFFALFCFFFAMWMLPYGFWMLAFTKAESIFWLKLLLIGAPIGAAFLCAAFLEMVGLVRKHKVSLIVLFFLDASVALAPLFPSLTGYYFSSFRALPFHPYWPIAGPGFAIFLFVSALTVAYGSFFLIRESKKIQKKKLIGINYLLLALLCWIIGGSSANGFNWFGFSIPPYGNFLVAFSGIFVAFAILKYQVFSVKAILAEILALILGVILFTLPFLVNTPFLRIFTMLIFFIFLFMGYELIKSTYDAIGEKEKSEQLIVKLSKSNLQTDKLAGELQEMNKSLEEKVLQRTKELQESYDKIEQRKQELERFYRLTVGRELKMSQLKTKIQELEQKNENQ